MTIRHNMVDITPEIAQQFMAQNDSNRAVSQANVEKYARDMANGDWENPSMEPIIIDTNNHMINGQHRMLALIKAGVTLTFLVVRGAKPESRKTLDSGRGRAISDYLHYQGETNTPMLSAVARHVHRIHHGRMAGAATISGSEITRILEQYPDVRHSAEMATLATGGRTQTPIAPSVFGAGHWMIAQVNGHADADLFIWRLYNLVGEGQGSPVLALNRRANEIKRARERVHQRDYLAMMIKAWNMDAQGKTAVKIATYSKTGTYVLPEVVKRKVSLVEVWDQEADKRAESPGDSDDEEE